MNILPPQEPPRYIKDEESETKFPNDLTKNPIKDTKIPYGYEDTKEYSYR